VDAFVTAERVENSYSIEAVSEDEKTFRWGSKQRDVINSRHNGNQLKEENVDFNVGRAFAKLVNESIVAIDK